MAIPRITFHFFLSIILLLLLLVFPLSSAVQTDCNINLESVLHAGGGGGDNSQWLSPSQEFAFGFRPLRFASDDGHEDLFLLSIWFNKIPDKTIVWSKNDHPVPQHSSIRLTSEGLILTSKGKEIWAIKQTPIICAAMLDSGNFVLLNAENLSTSTRAWESFASPTDTILPGQRIGVLGSLASRRSKTNYADGRFQLQMQQDGDVVLHNLVLPTKFVISQYWTSGTAQSQSNGSSSLQLVFDDEVGYIYLHNGNENVHNITKKDLGSKQNFYHMARLDFDGVFRHYNHPRRNYGLGLDAATCSTSSLWSVVQTTPDDVCSAITGYIGSGACGYNSFCVNSNGKPTCFCPERYSLLDPLDPYRGCKPDFPSPSCHPNGWESDFHLVDFKELNNTDFVHTDYEHQIGHMVDKDTCKEFCRRDCFCAAAVYNGNNCWMKRFPLSNGKQSPLLNRTVLLKVPKNNMTSFCPDHHQSSTVIVVVSALLGSSVFLNILLLVAIAIATFLVYRKKLLLLNNLQVHPHSSSVNGMRVLGYKELEEATRGFKDQLGRGSFGSVYKGVLPLSIPGRFIAVKKLQGEAEKQQGEKEFATEVSAIGQTHHKNLVKLLGYCNEGNHRLLVYEYMSNGSLAGHLFGLSRPHWNQRKQIAFGIARGLTYLHEECSTQIIHCDIKPQNILLDEHLTPKISDFGLAKLLLSEQSRAPLTHIRGTIGYFAPEWFRKASITVKVDVYSFGVMLLEMVCCMSSVKFGLGDEEEALVDWAYNCYKEGKVGKLVENDEEARNDMESVERVVMVGIWCIQEDPCLRPSMRRVTQMLEGIAQVSVPPRPTFFTSFSSINAAFQDFSISCRDSGCKAIGI